MSNRLSLNFDRYKPKQTYTFEVLFGNISQSCFFSDVDLQRLSTAVSSITVPRIQLQTIQDAELGYGTYWKTIPVHAMDTKELTVTFEETDDMLVTRCFAKFVCGYGKDSLSYRDVWQDPEISITVRYYNEYKTNTETGNAFYVDDEYVAIVKDFQHPTWNRSGNVDKIDVNVTFKVLAKDDVESYRKQITKRYNWLSNMFGTKEFIPEVAQKKTPKKQEPDNGSPANNAWFWNELSSYISKIFVAYGEWLKKYNKNRNVDTTQEFLLNTKKSDVGYTGKDGDDAIITQKSNSFCGRGAALQVALAYNITAYQGRSWGDGKDVAGTVSRELNNRGIKTKEVELNAKPGETLSQKMVQDELEMLAKKHKGKAIVYSQSYENAGLAGHVAIYSNGQIVSDFKQKGVGSAGFNNNKTTKVKFAVLDV